MLRVNLRIVSAHNGNSHARPSEIGVNMSRLCPSPLLLKLPLSAFLSLSEINFLLCITTGSCNAFSKTSLCNLLGIVCFPHFANSAEKRCLVPVWNKETEVVRIGGFSAFLPNFFLCQDHWYDAVPPHLAQPCYVALGWALIWGRIGVT